MKNKGFTKRYFGEDYLDTSSLPSKEELDKNLAKFKLKSIVPFIKDLPYGARVLDAGCGKGKTIRIIKAYRPDIKIYAVDISDVKNFLPKDVIFQQASVEEVGDVFKEDFFDAIICQHVLEHLVYPMAAMESFKKVLKNNGILYLETPNWTRIFIPFSSKFFWNDYTHTRVFSPSTIEKLLEDYSFEIKLIKTINETSIITKDDSVKNINKYYRKQRRSIWKLLKKIFKSAIDRLVIRFLRITLFAIAVNKK